MPLSKQCMAIRDERRKNMSIKYCCVQKHRIILVSFYIFFFKKGAHPQNTSSSHDWNPSWAKKLKEKGRRTRPAYVHMSTLCSNWSSLHAWFTHSLLVLFIEFQQSPFVPGCPLRDACFPALSHQRWSFAHDYESLSRLPLALEKATACVSTHFESAGTAAPTVHLRPVHAKS